MKECPIVEDLLPLYHERLLKDETTEWVERHLKTCSDCQALANMSAEPMKNDAIQAPSNHEKMMTKVTSKLTLYQLIFVGLSFFLAIRTVIVNENFGFILAYFVLGLLTYLFYKRFKVVIIIAFLPVFFWYAGMMIYDAKYNDAYPDMNIFEFLWHDVLYAAFMMAGIHLLFAILGAVVGLFILKLRESGEEYA